MLGRNYRSSRRILASADELVSHNVRRFKRKLYSEHEEGERLAVLACLDETEEARAVAERAHRLIRAGTPAGEIAVFYRTNAMSRALEMGFAREGVPYRVVAGIEFFQRREVKDLLAYLMLALNPNDDLAFVRCLDAPPKGLGTTSLGRLRDLARTQGRSLFGASEALDQIPRVSKKAKGALEKFRALVEELRVKNEAGGSVGELLRHTSEATGYEAYLTGRFDDAGERLAHVAELLDAADSYDERPAPDGLRGFLEEAALAGDQDGLDERSDTVKLMTLHAAKGLEFDHVFTVGLEEGLLPLLGEDEDDGEELEEERRLLYVGITRARKSAALSYAHFRRQYGREEARLPSRFLTELPEEHVTVTDLASEAEGHYRPGRLAYVSAPKPRQRSPEGPQPGEWVEHPTFGQGQVMILEPDGDDGKATVRFVDGSTRVLILKYAKLSRLERRG